MKSVMMKWLHSDYNERGFGICVSVVVSHELYVNHSGGLNLLVKITNGILNSHIPSHMIVARLNKLLSEVFSVSREVLCAASCRCLSVDSTRGRGGIAFN